MSSSSVIQNTKKADLLGVSAGTICLIHCLATPFIFVASAGLAAHHDHHDHHDHHHHGDIPVWWGFIDIFFLLVGLAAVYWAAKHTAKQWMKIALYASWALLAFVLINERMGFIPLAEEWIYVPTLSLVGFHLYNRKYCQCEDEDCPV